jgi:hypothetical protein
MITFSKTLAGTLCATFNIMLDCKDENGNESNFNAEVSGHYDSNETFVIEDCKNLEENKESFVPDAVQRSQIFEYADSQYDKGQLDVLENPED